MKRILNIAACAVFAAASIQAATVGWSIGKTDAAYKGDAYQFFVVGQNNVKSIADITAMIEQGKDVSSYAYGSGTLTSNTGGVTVSPANSGKTLGSGNYTGFFVIYDATTAAAATKYVATGDVTASIGDSTAQVSFLGKDQSSLVNNASNWHPVPEPTAVALLALGLAAFGLKRKVA